MSSFFLPGTKWLWSEYKKELIDKAILFAKKKWQQFHWDEAEEKYRSHLRNLHSTTRLLGHPKPIDIENIFTDVYIFDRPTTFWRYGIKDFEKRVSGRGETIVKRKRTPALQLVTENKRLFILGKPGAGKTTLLKYLTLQACLNKLHKTPIFVSMKDLIDSELELVSYLVQQFDICAFPNAEAFIKQLLKRGGALVLLDGLDEVTQEGEKFKKVIREVVNFADRYLNTQICITCRIAATDYSFDKFVNVEIADFDDTQIQSFVSKWYKDLPSNYSRFMKEFSRPENCGLRQLARTPLLLALLCLAFDETMTFPSRRVELYREALDALLKKWDASRGIKRDEIYRGLSSIRKEQLLSWLAAKNFTTGTIFFEQEILCSQISSYLRKLPGNRDEPDGEAVLKAIEAQHGILVEYAHRIYSFLHLTFQEYLTARYIVENFGAGNALKEFVENSSDARWHEVLLLVVSLLGNADYFFEEMIRVARRVLTVNPNCNRLINWVSNKAISSSRPDAYGRALLLLAALDLVRCSLYKDLAEDLYKDFPVLYATMRDLQSVLDIALDLAIQLDPNNDKSLSCLSLLVANKYDNDNLRIYKIASEVYSSLHVRFTKEDLDTSWHDFSVRDVQALQQYLVISRLIIECLEFAVVSDREGITSRMILPWK